MFQENAQNMEEVNQRADHLVHKENNQIKTIKRHLKRVEIKIRETEVHQLPDQGQNLPKNWANLGVIKNLDKGVVRYQG